MILEAGIGLQAVRLADVADAARQLARPPAGCRQIALQAMDSSGPLAAAARDGRRKVNQQWLHNTACAAFSGGMREATDACKRSTCTAGGSFAGAASLMRLPSDESAGGAICSWLLTLLGLGMKACMCQDSHQHAYFDCLWALIIRLNEAAWLGLCMREKYTEALDRPF